MDIFIRNCLTIDINVQVVRSRGREIWRRWCDDVHGGSPVAVGWRLAGEDEDEEAERRKGGEQR